MAALLYLIIQRIGMMVSMIVGSGPVGSVVGSGGVEC